MRYKIRLTSHAERQIEHLPSHVRNRVARWIDLLGDDPRRTPSRQIEGYPDLRRIHASKDYVIVYSIIEAEVVVLIVQVAHRREVYRRL